MASNTRGRIKERFVGIHKNFEWIRNHCQQSINLIDDKNPAMTKAMIVLSEGVKILDDLAQDIYGKL